MSNAPEYNPPERDLIERWSRFCPAPPAAAELNDEDLFGDPAFKPSYDDWAKRPAWTTDDVTALFLGYSPDELTPQYVEENEHVQSELIPAYFELRSRVEAAISTGVLSDPIRPMHALYWASEQRLRVADGLRSAVDRAEGWVSAAETRCREQDEILQQLRDENASLRAERDILRAVENERPVPINERRSMDAIIIAASMKKYGWTPDKRTTVVSEIVTHAATLGISVDEGTVLTRIRKAYARYKRQIAEAHNEKEDGQPRKE